MNANRPSEVDQKSLQILDELSNNDSLTQRDLSGRRRHNDDMCLHVYY